ncbi:MAG TPA: SIMPL domain-containing protein [Polyangia bacterium]|jgi:hypothetical protein
MHQGRAATLVSLVLTAALAAGLALVLGPAAPARAAAPEPERAPRRIEVDAKATLEVAPDRVSLTLQIAERRARPHAAVAEAWKRRAAVLAALGRAGVAAADLTASQATRRPVYRDGRPDGFEAQLSVVALVRAPDALGHLVEAAVDAGATSFQTQLESSRMPEMKKRVREMALAAGREKAQQIAQATGVALGPLQAVAEHQGSTGSWPFGGGEANVVNVTAAERGEAGRPGTLPLSLTLRVVYALR